MHAAYRALLFRDLRKRLATDPDYNSEQFPIATRAIARHPQFPPIEIVAPPSPSAAAATATATATAPPTNGAASASVASAAIKPKPNIVRMDELD